MNFIITFCMLVSYIIDYVYIYFYNFENLET
jgi:hypothetical protein